MRKIEEGIEYWKRQEELGREKRKTETFLDATGFCMGPGIETDANGYPVHFSTQTDSAIGAYIQWRKELEKYRDLFDSFRAKKDQWLKEEAIEAAEQFFMDSIVSGTAWGIPERHWLISIDGGSKITFELLRHRSVTLSISFHSSGKCSIHYIEWKNLKDVAWRLEKKEGYFWGKQFHPNLANHIVRRVVVHENNTSGMGKKYPFNLKQFYSNARARCKEQNRPYNPWQ